MKTGFSFRQVRKRLRTDCGALKVIGLFNELVPVLLHVPRRATLRCHPFRNSLGGHHLDCIPRANQQRVRAVLGAGQPNTNVATHAAFKVDLTPSLQAGMVFAWNFHNAIDWANFHTSLTARAVVGIDDGKFLGELFS